MDFLFLERRIRSIDAGGIRLTLEPPQFADSSGLKILLVHYPPYHSKYNPVERCWSALERHWNGALLTTIETSLKCVATMTWKQLRPIVWKLDNQYQRGKKLTKSQMKTISQRLHRLTGLGRVATCQSTPVARRGSREGAKKIKFVYDKIQVHILPAILSNGVNGTAHC